MPLSGGLHELMTASGTDDHVWMVLGGTDRLFAPGTFDLMPVQLGDVVSNHDFQIRVII